MRVLQVIDSLAPGGAERSLVDLAPRLVERGVELALVVLHDGPGLADEMRAAGASVTVLDGGSRPKWLASAVRLFRADRPDLVHTTLFEADVVGRMAARLAGVVSVSSLVTTPYGPEHLGEPGLSRFRVRQAQLADMATARLARRFRAVSVAVKEAYAQRLGLRPDRIDVIPEGRDPTRLGRRTDERRAAARTVLGVTNADSVVLAIGRLEPMKGFEVLIRSLPQLKERVPHARVFIAGRPGRSEPQLSRLVSDLGVEDAVQLLGHREDAADLLCGADVFVLPSHREGIPGALQEAMALEAPVVASDIGAVREALGPERPAELVPAGDVSQLAQAVARVLLDPDAARKKTDQARCRFLAEYDVALIANRMCDFYETALTGSRHS